MKAIVCTKYGPPEVLQLRDVERPIPKGHEIQIKNYATAVTSSDCIVRGFRLPRWNPVGILMGLVLGFTRPRKPILGMVLAGDVESVGKDVERFKKGDQVFAFTVNSAIKIRFGAYAEYTTLPEDGMVALKPANLSYEQAAAIPYGGLLALFYVKRGNIQTGQKVLIYGASGAIGTTAVQLAKYFGAEVTGICSTKNVDMVKSLGADFVIDYKQEDFTKRGELYDFIIDAVPMGMSNRRSLKSLCTKVLAPNGKYVSVDTGSPKHTIDDLMFLKELAESGKLKPVLDRTYPLEQMAEAHRYVDKGHKKGNVVISIDYKNKS